MLGTAADSNRCGNEARRTRLEPQRLFTPLLRVLTPRRSRFVRAGASISGRIRASGSVGVYEMGSSLPIAPAQLLAEDEQLYRSVVRRVARSEALGQVGFGQLREGGRGRRRGGVGDLRGELARALAFAALPGAQAAARLRPSSGPP